MIKSLDNLRDLLDANFLGKWSIGNPTRELEINESWIVLTFISDVPTVADDLIYNQSNNYQIAFYSTDPLQNIDNFFIDNELVYSFKKQVYIDSDSGYQTIYEFSI